MFMFVLARLGPEKSPPSSDGLSGDTQLRRHYVTHGFARHRHKSGKFAADPCGVVATVVIVRIITYKENQKL
jgi:hypothetical protein